MNTVFALWKRGLKAFVRNKTALVFSVLIPFFFIYVFGAIFKSDFIENPVAYMLSGVGLFMATIVKSGQTFQIVKTAVVMPLTFISGAYLPLSILPSGLKYFAYINPMTYATAFFRMVVLEKTNLSHQQLVKEGLAIDINGFIVTPLMSFTIIIAIGLIFLTLSTISFINTDFSRINRSSNDGSDMFG